MGSHAESARSRWWRFRDYDSRRLIQHPLNILLPLVCVLAHFQICAYAQDFAPTVEVQGQPANAAQAPDPNHPSNGEKAPQDQRAQGQKKKSKIPEGLVVAPIPISSPAIGTGAVLAGGYIFPPYKKDKISPPSTVGGAYFGTDNGTRGYALYGELYMGENRYHTTTVYVHGNINYDFYGVGVQVSKSSPNFL